MDTVLPPNPTRKPHTLLQQTVTLRILDRMVKRRVSEKQAIMLDGYETDCSVVLLKYRKSMHSFDLKFTFPESEVTMIKWCPLRSQKKKWFRLSAVKGLALVHFL